MLGHQNFLNVAFFHADKLCKERGMTEAEMLEIAQELNTAPDILEFIDRYIKYFGEDEIKLKI